MHVVILGAYGSAGAAAAQRLADHVGEGAPLDRLTLVDGGDPGGGLCILRGCMPSKEVLSAAEHRYRARHDERLVGDPPDIDLERTVERKNGHTSSFAAHRRAAVHELAEETGVEFVAEHARFVGPHELELSGGDRIDADYVVVATGSTVNVPDIEGLDDAEYLTSADVLDATDLPESGVVVGFGYVGVELVPYLAEAGVDLTVIEHDERPLDDAPPAFGDELLSVYREEFGVEILSETYERRVESLDDGGVRLHTDRDDDRATVEADGLFLFAGRRPNLDGLNLDATDLHPGPAWVDATMQAVDDDAGRTYVVGDANGRQPLLHVAKEQGFTAADNVLASARAEADADGADPAAAPASDPSPSSAPEPELAEYHPTTHFVMFAAAAVYPYARVGETAASARDAGREVVVADRRADQDGVFKTKAAARGRARLVVDAADGTVLGYQGFHYHADAMAKTMQVVVECELDVRDLPDRAFHPTTPEILDGLFREASGALDGGNG
ncbi:FAD-dependent oxidoreductase [Candidatus Halobonum tyrrellensis]|uniref:Pyruvate/2-oxoglutarate dehydrogenase complex, dihydrolipoamide dehydrogenase component n=1 Tax=Candidatus Halobonum tyrrellensis G22 TaxID=1324957 RepID=V4HF66_9EURY|nr:FAD-dependent oxidoreductase [Candidatus Halobonum tyrrellensis]ESP89310.1 pyruvate/2-oxoglutarate dehydrogenase complex, dihydrolipoamide dehydrogenase component [Candidatus Halobonum tyrrellensis G22]